MSDFGSTMMPSYWYGGNPNAGFQNNLAQNQAALANNQNFYSGLQNVSAQNQASLNNLYASGGGFGSTSYGHVGGYPSFGSAAAPGTYSPGSGRSSFSGASLGGGGAPTPVSVDSSPFDTGNAGAVPYLSGGGAPFGGGGFSDFTGRNGFGPAPPVPYQNSPPPGSFSPSPNYPGGSSAALPSPPNFNQTFGQFVPDGGRSRNMTALDAVQQFSGVGTGVAPQQPYALPPSMNSFEHAFGSLPEGGGFADRFGFRNAGTPSEYTTSPYTDAGGTTHQPSQMPPGFSTLFGTDNPGGALPRGGYPQQGSPGIMNQGDEPSGDTLTSGDRGLSAPNPFTSGASPFPFAGGYQGSMRDRIASALTGPLVQSAQAPPPTPSPTAPQMNNATDMLRAGRGWTIGQQVPPPQSGYAPINQAISSIGNASRPGMFDNLAQPLGQMFTPGTYRGR